VHAETKSYDRELDLKRGVFSEGKICLPEPILNSVQVAMQILRVRAKELAQDFRTDLKRAKSAINLQKKRINSRTLPWRCVAAGSAQTGNEGSRFGPPVPKCQSLKHQRQNSHGVTNSQRSAYTLTL
jgi:hypothetical protein